MKARTRVLPIGLTLFCGFTAFPGEWIARWPLLYDGWRQPEIKLAVDGTNAAYTLNHANRIGTLDKWSPSGQKIWSRVISTNASTLTEILIEPGGNVWAGSYQDLFRFAPDGTELRHITTVPGVLALALAPNAIHVSTYEYIRKYGLVSGTQWISPHYGDASVLALDPGGNAVGSGIYFGTRWTRKVSAAGTDLWSAGFGGDLSVSVSDSIVIALLNSAPTFEVLKLSAAGQLLWQSRYVAPITASERISRVTTDGDGNVYAVGSSGGGYAHGDILIAKYSPEGELGWVNRFKVSSLYDHPSLVGDVALASNHLVAVTGRDYFGMSENEVATLTVIYDASGNRVWTAREQPSSGPYYGGQSVAFDPAGNLYVAGTTSSDNTADYFLTRYAAPSLSGLPLIVQPPTNALASPGEDVTFSGTAEGAEHFQWLRNDDLLPGETNNTLSLTNVQRSDAAEFAVAVSNAAGTIVSPVGRLWFPPEILEPPRNFNLVPGDAAGLEVGVPWDGSLRYEWLRDGIVISNATSSRLWVTNDGNDVYGKYTVRVIDPFGATSTASAWIRPPAGVEVSWSQRQYDASEPVGVASLSDGTVFMVGNELRNLQTDYFILKRYGANGEGGVRTFYAPAQDAFAVKLLVGADGDLYVAGNERSPNGDLDFLLVRFDTNGAVRSEFRWDSGESADDILATFLQDIDGAMYLTGTAQRSSRSDSLVAIKIVQGTNIVWTAMLPPIANQFQSLRMAALDPTRNLYLVANLSLSNDYWFAITALSPDGNVRWRREGTSPSGVNDIAATASGIYAVGSAGVVNYDRDGNELWHRRFIGNGRRLIPESVLCAPDGAIFLAGGVTARLNGNDGTIQWLSTAIENSGRLALDPIGNILYAIRSSRDVAALRATDGLAFWQVMYGDAYGDYAWTMDASLHSSGDLLVTSQARDGSVDSLTRRFHSLPTAWPDVSGNRVLYVREGETFTLAETNTQWLTVQKRWHRYFSTIPGESENMLAIGPVHAIDATLYSLEAWDDDRRIHYPAWNVIFQPALRPSKYISGSNFYFSAFTELPQDATAFLQSSLDLIQWTTISTNNLSLPAMPWPPVDSAARFFRVVLP